MQEMHCPSVINFLIYEIIPSRNLWDFIHIIREPLVVFRCHKYIGEDGFSVPITVVFLWRDETRFRIPFRDTWWICPRGLKTKPSSIFEIHKLLQVIFGEVNMRTLSTGPWSMTFQTWPLNAKNALSLTKQFPSL